MIKKAVNVYAFIYACCFVSCCNVVKPTASWLSKKIDVFGEWLEYQIDHNDYLAGFLFAVAFVAIPYVIGVIDIVVTGGGAR